MSSNILPNGKFLDNRDGWVCNDYYADSFTRIDELPTPLIEHPNTTTALQLIPHKPPSYTDHFFNTSNSDIIPIPENIGLPNVFVASAYILQSAADAHLSPASYSGIKLLAYNTPDTPNTIMQATDWSSTQYLAPMEWRYEEIRLLVNAGNRYLCLQWWPPDSMPTRYYMTNAKIIPTSRAKVWNGERWIENTLNTDTNNDWAMRRTTRRNAGVWA